MTTHSPGPEPDDDDPPTPSSQVRGGTLYAEGAAPPEPAERRSTRGLRPSTVLTALLVAAGLALPGVAAFVLRPALPPPVAPAPAPSPGADTGSLVPPGPFGTSAPLGTTGPLAVTPAPSALPPATARVPTPALPASERSGAPTPTGRQALARLETRRTEPVSTALPVPGSRQAELRTIFEDPSRPASERAEAALSLLDALSMRGRWRTLARDAERISGMELPAHAGRLPAEQAHWLRFQALNNLGDREQLLVVGEAFLRSYPESNLGPPVATQMRSTVLARDSEERARRAMAASLQALEAETATKQALLERRGEPTTGLRRELARKHCSEPANARFHEVSVVTCRAFIDAWAPGETPSERVVVRDAWAAEIVALVGLRRYTEARERLAAFRAADPEGERQTIAGSIVLGIPPDAEE